MKLSSIRCLSLLILLILTPGMMLAGQGDPERVNPPKPLAQFALTDHNGADFTQKELTGKWSLILLGYTQCPDICPYTLQNLTLVIQEMSTRVRPDNLPQVVFIGVDPARDRAVLKDYVQLFREDFIGVTGEWDEIKKVVESLDGFVRIDRKASDGDNYQVFHSAFVAVINPQGRVAAHLNPPMDPAKSMLFLTALMRKHAKQIN